MGKVLFLFLIPFLGLWKSTQSFAGAVSYDTVFLGKPLFTIGSLPLYAPWNIITWYSLYHQYVPSFFRSALVWFLGSFVLFIVLLFIFKPKPPLTSHGSAHWAQYKDILKADFISGSGCVIGLYDSPWMRAVTARLWALEIKKNEKVSYAELSFEKQNEKKAEVLYNRLDKLQQRKEAADTDTEKDMLTKRIASVKNKLDKLPKYDAKKQNPLTVYPYVWLYKKCFALYKLLPHFYLRDNSNRHMAVFAPTRSGKGVGLIIPTLLGGWKSSVVINDIKSENWGITAGYRKRMGQKVIKFEPTADDGSSARWNPLDEIPIGTASELAMIQKIAEVIADYEGKGKLDHWGANAANVITAVILHLKYAHFADPIHYPHAPNLYTVASFLKANAMPAEDEEEAENGEMDIKGFVDTISQLQDFEHVPAEGIDIETWDTETCAYVKKHMTPAMLKEIYEQDDSTDIHPYTHPKVLQMFAEIASKPDNELGSIVSTANTALKEYLDPVLAANTSISDFCIDDMMNYKKPVSLYLVTPPSDLSRLAPIFKLFFEMLVKKHTEKIGEFINGQSKTLYRHKCLLLMDEFAALGNMKELAHSLAYIAGYGLKVFLICQGMPQIDNIYTKNNDIILNCHTQIYYAPNDNDTAKYVENLLGNETIEVESVSKSGGIGPFSKDNYSYSQISRPLLTAEECKRLGDEEVISATGHPPIKTDKIKYYEHRFFTSRLKQAPPVSDVIRNNPNPLREKLLASLQHAKKNKAAHQKPAFTYQTVAQATAQKEEITVEEGDIHADR